MDSHQKQKPGGIKGLGTTTFDVEDASMDALIENYNESSQWRKWGRGEHDLVLVGEKD